MKGFTAFMKKELLEAVRSYKLVILLIVFAALGFMNPVSARYLPELVAGFLPEGMHMERFHSLSYLIPGSSSSKIRRRSA